MGGAGRYETGPTANGPSGRAGLVGLNMNGRAGFMPAMMADGSI